MCPLNSTIDKSVEYQWKRSGGYDVMSHIGASLSSIISAKIVEGLSYEMPRYRIKDYFAAKPEVLSNMDWTVCVFDTHTGNCCAFLCAQWLPFEGGTIMLYTLLIGERQQGGRVTYLALQGLFELLARLDTPVFCRLILKTANPQSYRIMELFERLPDAEFYPSRSRKNSISLTETASRLARFLHPMNDFTSNTGTIAGAAGAVPMDFYPDNPVSRDSNLNHFFAERISLADRMLCVLDLPTNEVKRSLFRHFKVLFKGKL
jgi:hypothetical protein